MAEKVISLHPTMQESTINHGKSVRQVRIELRGFLSCEKTIRLSVFSTWITASLFSVNHKISGPNLETL